MTAAERRVRRAIEDCAFLREHAWHIVRQGSFHNNTNVRAESDVDLAVCLDNVFISDGPPNDVPTLEELGRVPSPVRYDNFKADLAAALEKVYGPRALLVGTKALQLHADDQDRVSVDIVPAFRFEVYGPRKPPSGRRGAPTEGIVLTPNGQRITNFPEQHYANGCAKNVATGNRFKWVVRVLKNLRNHIADDAAAPATWRQAMERTPSFLIECLVFNCPNELFGHEDIYEDVIAVLHYLAAELARERRGLGLLSVVERDLWMEVNRVKYLFGVGQAWSETEAAAFVAVAEAYVKS